MHAGGKLLLRQTKRLEHHSNQWQNSQKQPTGLFDKLLLGVNMGLFENLFSERNEITLENFNKKLKLGEYFYLMTYQEYYKNFLEGLNNKKKIISELFVFRGWTTQFGFRLFSSKPLISEKIIESIVAQGKQLGIRMLNELEQVDIEKETSMRYIDLIDSRWQEYDNMFIENKSSELPIPTRQICGKLEDFCEIKDPAKFVWICNDFILHLNNIKEDAIQTGLLK